MVKTPTVLLATYNGLPYLSELLDSLKRQTIPFACLIQDDGSTDGTVDVLKDLCASDSRFSLSPLSGQHFGAAGNFLSLLSQTKGPVACCDQDDLWEENRLERCMQALEQTEKQYGGETPILVHSDLSVIAEDGTLLHESFFRHQGWDPKARSLSRLLVQNNVTGAACLMNEPLRKLIAEHAVADNMFMHDWFFAQTAAAFGRIVFVPESLVRYRQHGTNAIGASTHGTAGRFLEALRMPAVIRKRLKVNETEATCLLQSYAGILPEKQEKIIRDFLAISKAPKVKRPFLLKKGDYLMQSPVTRLGQYLMT
ncbi:MAG: glycosyltransferase family 2 protein [Clostridia bacterium]|nr:glycosyltransferase family 2 protein [Clostridia bacterium]